MDSIFKYIAFLVAAMAAAGCLPTEEDPGDPFSNSSSSSNGLEVFDALAKVAMTGFIDPNEYSDLFSSETGSALALAEGDENSGSILTETGVQAFFYGLRTKENGEYERVALGTANVNDQGFFEFSLPEGIPVFASIGHVYGDRMRSIFTAPFADEVTDGAKENSILVEQTPAMDYAASVLFKKLEEYPAFQEMINSGLNTGAIQMAGAVYEDALLEGNIEEWTETDIAEYTEKLLEKMTEMNETIQTGGLTPADVYSVADLRSFNYDTILTGINSQTPQDLAYRVAVGSQTIDSALTAISATLDSDVNSKALEEMDLDGMDNALYVAKAAAKVKLRSNARRNFSGDELKAVLAGVDVNMKRISTLSAAKSELVGFAGKSAATNNFTSILTASVSQDYNTALRSIFSGLNEDEKAEFKAKYDGATAVDPDEHDDELLEIMRMKCQKYGGQVSDVPAAGVDAQTPLFISDHALFYCSFPSESSCLGASSSKQTEIYDLFGYNFFGNTTLTLQSTSVKFCKVSDVKVSNDALEEGFLKASKYDPESYFITADMCRKMGAHVPSAPSTDTTNYNQYCYFHVKP